MHVLLVLRADEFEGRTENSEEARELAMNAEALKAYECRRWPNEKAAGGKGWRLHCEFPHYSSARSPRLPPN
jgi:hypothetical protein